MRWLNAIAEEELAEVCTPEPYLSDGARRMDHQTIPFITGPELVRKHLLKSGYGVGNSQFVLDKQKLGFIGSMDVLDYNGDSLLKGLAMSISIIMWGSHNKKVAWKIGTGTETGVCLNFEMFNANVSQFTAKHTVNALSKLDTLVSLSVDSVSAAVEEEKLRQAALRSHHITLKEGDHHLVEIHLNNDRSMTSNQLSVAAREWRKPSYPEHTAYDEPEDWLRRPGKEQWSAYRLLQACTEAQKPAGNRTQVNYDHIAHRTKAAGDYINNVINFRRAA